MFPPQRMAELEQVVLGRWTPESFRRFQCVWLSAMLELPAGAIADALGLNVSTVRRIRAEFAREGAGAIDGKGNRGGRRNQYLTLDEEVSFVREHGALVEGEGGVHTFKEALERRLGRSVHKTTVYRLLERHGIGRGLSRGRAGAQGRRRASRKAR